ncbi:MAG: hypothetical protein RLZZ292_453 [Bacteroidota bacterium]|jgi:ATP-binding cassette, subfamily B, bacterial
MIFVIFLQRYFFKKEFPYFRLPFLYLCASILFFQKKMALNKKLSLRDQFTALRNLPAFFRMIWGTNPNMAIGNLVLRLFKSAIPLSQLYLGKLIIDEVIQLYNHSGGDKTMLWKMVGLELGLVILSELLNRAIILLDSLLGDLFSNRISVLIMRHAATLDLYQFEDATFYDKLERARQQTTGRTILMSQVLEQFQDIVTVVFLGIGLVAFNPWLILILVLAVIPSFLGESHFNQRNYSLSLSWTPERRELDYLRFIGASDETAKEVKMFNLSDFLAKRFEAISTRYFLENRKIALSRAGVGVLLSFLGTASYYAAYVFTITQTINGLISVGTLTFLAGSFERMRGTLQTFMSRFSKIIEGSMYLNDLFDFLSLRPNIEDNERGLPFPTPIQHGFTFENVSFKYLNSEKYAVKNLSFHLQAGEKLALVGENGAGKTTVVKLLARLYEPNEGRILLDGKDLKLYNIDAVRNSIGVIFQDFIRFQMKAYENVAIGNIDKLTDRPRIEDSAHKSLADSVIEGLPAQYDQILGKRFAKGVDLSGGQWQKIALARAYMRDAQLLILDEPTAALDARAEHEVFLRFSELIHGKCAVLISHRFSTVRMADKIMFLEQGQVSEIGTHDELVEKGGKYAELFQLQAKGYS